MAQDMMRMSSLVLVPLLKSCPLTAGRVPVTKGKSGGESGTNEDVSSSSLWSTTSVTVDDLYGLRGGVGSSGGVTYRTRISRERSD